MEELYECDVMWPEHCHSCSLPASNYSIFPQKQQQQKSPPVSIPKTTTCSWKHSKKEDCTDLSGDEVIPPHVMTSRRNGGLASSLSSSVCSGQGRTLKGRDLRLVRDSVLRMTGFLEG